jgi:enoyl-CoA hydratase/carnithine racemase
MPIIEWNKKDGVAVLVMNNGENRHNPEFISALLNAFDEIERDETVTAVVITSSDQKNWSQGIDVQWIMGAFGKKDLQSVRDFLYGLNKIFKRILLYPMPVIAAINGHTFGNGALLACACDFRFMKSDKGFFCFPEVDINIPFLPGMIALIRKTFPEYKIPGAVLTGKRMAAPELFHDKAITWACEDQDELMQEALAFAKTFNKKRPIFAELKKRLHKEIIETMDTQDPAYIEPLQIIIQ